MFRPLTIRLDQLTATNRIDHGAMAMKNAPPTKWIKLKDVELLHASPGIRSRDIHMRVSPKVINYSRRRRPNLFFCGKVRVALEYLQCQGAFGLWGQAPLDDAILLVAT